MKLKKKMGQVKRLMTTQQPIYLFAGGRGRSIPTTFANFRKVIKNIGKEKPIIAYVGVATLKTTG